MKQRTRALARYIGTLVLAVLLLSCLLLCSTAANEEAALSSYSVTLGEDIGLNVYVEAAPSAEVSVAFTYRGTRTLVQDADERLGLRSFSFHGVLPQHLDESIAIEVLEAGVPVDACTVSVGEYLRTLPADGARATAEAVLLYGAAARQYMGLADATDLSELPSAESITAVAVDHPTGASDAAFLLRRLGLTLADNVSAYLDIEAVDGGAQPPSVRVYVGSSGTPREAAIEALPEHGMWRATVPLKASELLDTSFTVSVQGTTGDTDTVTLGATSYLSTVALGEDAALSTLARAIYHYAVMANDLADGHAYSLAKSSAPTCNTSGLTVWTCAVCGDVKSEVTAATGTHGQITTTVKNGVAVCRCTVCGDSFTAELSAYALGDDISENFEGSSTNLVFTGELQQLPQFSETDNTYYAFVRGSSGTAQAQFYANNVGAETETSTARMGLISLRLKRPEWGYELDGAWTIQLYNGKGQWSQHAQNKAKGLPVLIGYPDGAVYASNKDKSAVEELAMLSTDAWTRIDVLFEKVGSNIRLSYYVNGRQAFVQTLANTLRAKMPCGIYFTTSALSCGASFLFDDVIFAYADTPRDSFLQDEHSYETVERVAPTCFEEGYELVECVDCDATRLVSLTSAHDLEEISRTDPSCFSEGLLYAKCGVCGMSVEEHIPALGTHSFGDWTVKTPPSTTSEGLQQRHCSTCGEVEDKIMLRLNASSINTIYMTGSYEDASKTNDVTMQIEYVPTEGEGFSCYGTIHWQGATSLNYPAKNYTLKLFKDEELTEKQKVNLGWGKENKYCLKANWVDCTSARNIVACRLWADIVEARPASALRDRLVGLKTNAGAIDGFPIAVYMNGQFHGLYTMNVPKDEWMFDMDDVETEAILMGENWATDFTEEITGFYVDSYGDWKSNGGAWEMKYFGTEKTTGDPTWVKDSFNALIRFARDMDGDAFRAGIDQYLDVDATIDYLLYMYAIFMRDNSAKNILWATYDGKVWFPTVYDQDGTFGMAWDGIREAPPTAMLPKVVAQGGGYVVDPGTSSTVGSTNVLFPKLLNLYTERVLDRYYELRESVLTEEHMKTTMAEFLAEIPDDVLAADREKWNKPGVGQFEWDYTERWISRRLVEMDKAMAAIAEAVGYVR